MAEETTNDSEVFEIPEGVINSFSDVEIGGDEGDSGAGDPPTNTPPAGDPPAGKAAETGKPADAGDTKPDSKAADPAPVKSFDEELLTRFEGKFKTVDEVIAKINEAPADPFASPFIKHLNELEKAGTKIDQNFIKELTMNYEQIENPVELLMEDLRRSDPKYKNWTAAELEFEIRHQYRMSEWAEEGEEPTEIQKVYNTRMTREAAEAKERLISKRDSLKNVPTIDPKVAEQASREKAAKQADHEKYIDSELVSKIDKISTALEKDKAFDYQLDQEVKSEVGQLLKEMGPNVNVFWKQFYDDGGRFSINKVYDMMVRAKSYDKAVSLAREQGKAEGSEAEHRNLSNANFDTASGKGRTTGDLSLGEAAARSLSDNF